jgi:5'-3' exonuclease
MPAKRPRTRLLFDTSSLMYRAFFALPPSIKDGDGHSVNAVHGYLDMTGFLIDKHHPDEAVHVYDHDWRPAPRVALYDGYKGNRKEDPPELPPQFDMLREVLDALGQPQAEAPGWEADDAIATMVARVKPGSGDKVDIVTGDRDLIQLVRDPEIRVLFTIRGVSQIAEFDEKQVQAKYGLPASRYSDFAILRGDPSDGLPGVYGVGEKTAASLVASYGSLNELVEAAEARSLSKGPRNRSPRLLANLRAAVDYIRTMQKVVPMRTDVDVTEWRKKPDPELLDELVERHRLAGPIGRYWSRAPK